MSLDNYYELAKFEWAAIYTSGCMVYLGVLLGPTAALAFLIFSGGFFGASTLVERRMLIRWGKGLYEYEDIKRERDAIQKAQ